MTSPSRSACASLVWASATYRISSTEEQTCSYCHETQEAIGIEELADHIEGAFNRHYQQTSTEPNDYEFMLQRDGESSYEWERHGEPINWAIVNAADVRRRSPKTCSKSSKSVTPASMRTPWAMRHRLRATPTTKK